MQISGNAKAAPKAESTPAFGGYSCRHSWPSAAEALALVAKRRRGALTEASALASVQVITQQIQGASRETVRVAVFVSEEEGAIRRVV